MIYWKHDIALFKKRRKRGVNYINSKYTHFSYNFYGLNVGRFVLGLMVKTGEENPKWNMTKY